MINFINKKILIVVAHPDDEVLGLGGTMNYLIRNYSIKTRVVILGEGITSRSSERDIKKWNNELLQHKKNIKSASKIIGYHETKTYNLPDNRFDIIPLLDIIKIIEKEKNEFNPEIIFTHHNGDLNIDHQLTYNAVITACRPMSNEKVQNIITFETMSGTEWKPHNDPRHFLPNLFFSIPEENINIKSRAMEAYKYEKRDYPHPRSPLALKIVAQRWGIMNGCNFAEAFCIIRSIIKH
jgi:LmbE family N-acetylglucosaminyl deacetylase